MSTKTAKTTPFDVVGYTVMFWTWVETHCKHKGSATMERAYFGLRTSDPIEFDINDKPFRTTVEGLWKAFNGKAGLNLDLTASSILAVNARQLRSYVVKGKGKNLGKTYGAKFWTLTNPKFLATPSTRKASLADQLPSLT